MAKVNECPLCHGTIPDPINGNEVSILGVATYWLTYLHEKNKGLMQNSDEPAVQEQIRLNLNTIVQLIRLWD